MAELISTKNELCLSQKTINYMAERLANKIRKIVDFGEELSYENAKDLVLSSDVSSDYVILILVKCQNGEVLEIRQAKSNDFNRHHCNKKEVTFVTPEGAKRTTMEINSKYVSCFYRVQWHEASYFL